MTHAFFYFPSLSYSHGKVSMHLSAMEIDIPKAPPKTIALKTANTGTEATNVNREARTINNVLLIRAGQADGHGFGVEKSFIEECFKYIKKNMGGRVQCNMGHQYDSLMYQLGRFTSFKMNEDHTEIYGNLGVFEAADESPALPGMANWLLKIAEEDPQAVMCSITFEAKAFYQYDDKGNKVYIQRRYWGGPIKQFEDRDAYAEFSRLFSCDIVDQGALTDTLFSAGKDSGAAATFARIVNDPKFIEFLEENHTEFPQLKEFYQEQVGFSVKKLFQGIFSSSSKDMNKKDNQAPAAPATPAVEEAAAETNSTDLSAAIDAAVAPLRQQIESLQSENKAKDARIEALEKLPAAEATEFQTNDPSNVNANQGNSWDANPVTMKARAMSQPRK